MRPWKSTRPTSPSFAMSSPGRLEALVPWVPVMVGVGIMIGLLIAAVALSPSGPSTATGLPRSQSPTQPSGQGQSLGAEDGLGAGGTSPSDPLTASVPMSRSVTPSRVSTATGAAGSGTAGSGGTGSGSGANPPAPQPPAATVVSGRYQVLNSYVDSFIGEVLVSNSSSSPHDWVVQLRFPSNVGSLRTSWVESQPQATLTRSGQTFIWTSTVPAGARSSVALRFQFDRTGTNSNPATCTVNGTACSGL
jgi:hypothetical protein